MIVVLHMQKISRQRHNRFMTYNQPIGSSELHSFTCDALQRWMIVGRSDAISCAVTLSELCGSPIVDCTDKVLRRQDNVTVKSLRQQYDIETNASILGAAVLLPGPGLGECIWKFSLH